MKKSQVSGYAFIYILTAVLVSVIFIYGYRTIISFRESSEEISYLKFRNDVNSRIKSIYFDFDSEATREFSLPSKFRKVCFIDNFDNKNNFDFEANIGQTITEDNKLTLSNVYLMEGIAPTRKFATEEKIEINRNEGAGTYDNLCITPINGKIALRLKGRGDHAEIKKAG